MSQGKKDKNVGQSSRRQRIDPRNRAALYGFQIFVAKTESSTRSKGILPRTRRGSIVSWEVDDLAEIAHLRPYVMVCKPDGYEIQTWGVGRGHGVGRNLDRRARERASDG
jgi:hypothetical protein